MTIFDKDELKYTQADIDVRDAKIKELQEKIEKLEIRLHYEKFERYRL